MRIAGYSSASARRSAESHAQKTNPLDPFYAHHNTAQMMPPQSYEQYPPTVAVVQSAQECVQGTVVGPNAKNKKDPTLAKQAMYATGHVLASAGKMAFSSAAFMIGCGTSAMINSTVSTGVHVAVISGTARYVINRCWS